MSEIIVPSYLLMEDSLVSRMAHGDIRLHALDTRLAPSEDHKSEDPAVSSLAKCARKD